MIVVTPPLSQSVIGINFEVPASHLTQDILFFMYIPEEEYDPFDTFQGVQTYVKFLLNIFKANAEYHNLLFDSNSDFRSINPRNFHDKLLEIFKPTYYPFYIVLKYPKVFETEQQFIEYADSVATDECDPFRDPHIHVFYTPTQKLSYFWCCVRVSLMNVLAFEFGFFHVIEALGVYPKSMSLYVDPEIVLDYLETKCIVNNTHPAYNKR